MQTLPNNKAIILFDGVCNFCNSSINFIIRHDKKNHFLFAPLQSAEGKELMESYNIDSSQLDTMILIEDNKVFYKSTAALLITKHLNRLYPMLYSGIIVPRFMRDKLYDYFAKKRYKWFGRRETCMIPDEEVRGKFIS